MPSFLCLTCFRAVCAMFELFPRLLVCLVSTFLWLSPAWVLLSNVCTILSFVFELFRCLLVRLCYETINFLSLFFGFLRLTASF